MPNIPWFSSSSPSQSKVLPPPPPPPPPSPPPPSSPLELLDHFRSKLQSIPPETQTLVLGSFALGAFSTFGTRWAYLRFFKRIQNSDWVTPRDLERKRWVKGYVTSVGDADNFRFYHTPGFGWRWPLKFRSVPSTSKDLRNQTLHIRMGGVDAPEAAHFGNIAQPYAGEALSWLKHEIEGKVVYCQLLKKDQYGRVVAMVHHPSRIPFTRSLLTGQSLSILMLRSGWAEVYQQSGAEYGKWGKEHFLELEQQAKAAGKGVWAQPEPSLFASLRTALTGESEERVERESAADYKRRVAAMDKEKPTKERESKRPGA